jgi:hypothetical protein
LGGSEVNEGRITALSTSPRTSAALKDVEATGLIAPLFLECLKLERELNEAKSTIIELTAAGNCLRHDKELLAGVIRNAGGHAHVQWSTDNWNNAKDWDRRKNGTI